MGDMKVPLMETGGDLVLHLENLQETVCPATPAPWGDPLLPCLSPALSARPPNLWGEPLSVLGHAHTRRVLYPPNPPPRRPIFYPAPPRAVLHLCYLYSEAGGPRVPDSDDEEEEGL